MTLASLAFLGDPLDGLIEGPSRELPGADDAFGVDGEHGGNLVGGTFRLERADYHGPRCGQGKVPWDELLGLDRPALTPGFRERGSGGAQL